MIILFSSYNLKAQLLPGDEKEYIDQSEKNYFDESKPMICIGIDVFRVRNKNVYDAFLGLNRILPNDMVIGTDFGFSVKPIIINDNNEVIYTSTLGLVFGYDFNFGKYFSLFPTYRLYAGYTGATDSPDAKEEYDPISIYFGNDISLSFRTKIYKNYNLYAGFGYKYPFNFRNGGIDSEEMRKLFFRIGVCIYK